MRYILPSTCHSRPRSDPLIHSIDARVNSSRANRLLFWLLNGSFNQTQATTSHVGDQAVKDVFSKVVDTLFVADLAGMHGRHVIQDADFLLRQLLQLLWSVANIFECLDECLTLFW